MNQSNELEKEAQARIEEVCEFVKTAFAVEGKVTSTGRECTVVEKDGSISKGVSFLAEDRERGKFIVTIGNPEPFDPESVQESKD
jgi:hypothetical protein